MATARINTTRSMHKKDKKPIKNKSRDYTAEIDSIKDDDENLMRISKSRTVGSALPFGRFKISDTTTVELCCNQDLRTAAIANRACRQLIKRFMKADMAESQKILDAVLADMEDMEE